MSKKDLIAALRDHPDRRAALAAAFDFLRTFHRDATGAFRLVGEDGRHVPWFDAAGKRYNILTPDDNMPLLRTQNLRARLAMVGSDTTLTDQYQMLQRIKAALNQRQPDYVGAAAGIESMLQALTKADRAFPFAAEAACLFVVLPGEDLGRLPTEAEKEAKMQDWNDAGLNGQDFFFLCLHWAWAWNESTAAYLQRLGGLRASSEGSAGA
jgi:hypothetical protein